MGYKSKWKNCMLSRCSRLFIVSLLFTQLAQTQPPSPAAHIITGLVLPARCSPLSGDIYNIPDGFYRCSAAPGTWTKLAAVGGVVTSFNTRIGAVKLTSTDVINTFTSCSGTQYLGADGACHTSSGGVPSGVNQFQWDSAGSFAGAPNLLRRSATSVGVGADAASGPITVALSIQDFTTAALNEGVYLEIDKAGKTQSVLRGIDTELFTSAASNITTVTGQTIIISNDGASTMGSATGLRVSLENTGGSTMTDEFGINIIGDSSTGVTNKHGLYIGAQTGASGINEAIHTEAGLVVHEDVMTSANVQRGSGSPEGAVVGVVGDIYQRTDGGTGTSLYRKESGSSNTGWVAVASGGASPGAPDNSLQYRVNGTTFGGMSGSSWDNAKLALDLQDSNMNDALYIGLDPTLSTPSGFLFNSGSAQPNAVTMGNGQDGGGVEVRAFTGGNTSDAAGFGGAGGQFNARSGSGGNGGLGALGGDVNFAAGSGGNGSAGNGGAGGGVFFIAGDAGTGGDANGGDISFRPGTKQGVGVAGKVIVNGAFATDLGSCTAATLSTILTANTDACMCTDCQPTSGSDDTCTGSGGIWLAYKTASAVVCR